MTFIQTQKDVFPNRDRRKEIAHLRCHDIMFNFYSPIERNTFSRMSQALYIQFRANEEQDVDLEVGFGIICVYE